jgi:hypothetical protein
MIVFNLACSHGHAFEGWFSSVEDFEKQQNYGLVACPLCGDAHVEKGLSAPRLNLGHAPAAAPESAGARKAYLGTHQQILQHFKSFLLANTENVGGAFAETARRIHYGEESHRNIRGRVTGEQADELREEGIETMTIPGELLLDESIQ